MARSTTSERRKAQGQARETARFQRKSSEAATRLGVKLISRSLAAFKRGDALAIREIIEKEFKKVEPIMVELMTVAYLTGFARLRSARKDSTVAAALLHREVQRALSKRLQIDQGRLKELTAAQNVEAVKMLGRVQGGIEKKIEGALVRINQQGLTTTEGVKELRKAFTATGIRPFKPFEIEAIFRTQSNFSYSAGSWAAAQDPAVDEILWGYKYVTAGDARVRDEHVILDGTTAPKNDPIWQQIWPPNGWNCRCQIIYIFDKTETVLPQPQEIDGRIVQPVPDPGFNFNAGTVLQPGGSSVRKSQAVGKKITRKASKKRPKKKKASRSRKNVDA